VCGDGACGGAPPARAGAGVLAPAAAGSAIARPVRPVRSGAGGRSSGTLPKAPHIRLNAPLSGSSTITRLFPYPSATKSSFVLRSEEHTSELQSLRHLVCRLLLEKKKNRKNNLLEGVHQ